jgi:hypothetical protein
MAGRQSSQIPSTAPLSLHLTNIASGLVYDEQDVRFRKVAWKWLASP